jgi:hypothetical protein
VKTKKNLASGALAFGLILGLAACAESVTPNRSPQQVWIDAHPTYPGDDGQCIEFDGEVCDDDPFDLDDMAKYPHLLPSSKPVPSAPRPMQTAKQPAPKPTKRR